jgi:2-polyprenyl-3-methyl-5-hydroxy-6-metoxy-1,4-benzoquinol methylase
MPRLIRNPTGSDPEIVELRRRLDAFYSTTTTYQAFQATVPRDDLYRLLDPLIDQRITELKGARPVRVLELGAGRTGYPDYLAPRGATVAFDAQDVTASNLEYLQPRCAYVHVGDISEIREDAQSDLILSTNVFEHVSTPTE